MHREPEVPEAVSSSGKFFDLPARITSKKCAPIHFVKNGILQNACSTSPRVVVQIWGKVLMCTPPG